MGAHFNDDPGRARDALHAIDPGAAREDWVRAAMAAQAAGLDADDFIAWSRGASNFKSEADCRSVWRSIKPGRGVGAGTLFGMARAAGWSDSPQSSGTVPAHIALPRPSAAAERQNTPPAPWFDAEAAWASAEPATPGHPYIARKLGLPDGLRVYRGPLRVAGQSLDGALLVPAFDAEGVLSTWQAIPAEAGARKLNAPGRAVAGTFTVGGAFRDGEPAYLCEGVGAAWSAHQATGKPAVVAFGAGRMEAVARSLRERFPAARLVLVADVGKESDCQRIASIVGGLWVAPPGDLGANGDANDLHQRDGLQAVADLLAGAKPAATGSTPAESRFPALSADGLEPDDLFEAPTIPPMDLSACLPAVLAEYADAMGRAGGLDAGAYAVAALPVLAAATDRSVRVSLGPTHTSSILLWAALIGRTGAGKSPPMDAAVAPLAKMHADAVRRYAADMEAWKNASKDDRGPAPTLQARYLTDATIEAVVAKLGDSKGPRLLRHADEGSGWLNAMGRYSNGAGGDGERSTWLTAWVGPQPCTVSRIGRGDVLVPEMGACVLMGITPDKMREGYREATGEGVLGRTLLYLLEPARTGLPDKSVAPAAARHAYDELVHRVARARGVSDLGAEAQGIYDARRSEWRSTMTAIQDVSPGLASVLAKANENFGRLAMLFETAGERVGASVGGLAASRAGALMDYLLRHAVVAHQHLFVQDTVVGVAKALALKILRDGPQPENRVERRAIGRTAAFEQADEPTRRAAIDYLAGARWLVAPDTKRVRLGMRFSEATAWRVNPKVYERFADVADRSRKEAERALAALAGLRG